MLETVMMLSMIGDYCLFTISFFFRLMSTYKIIEHVVDACSSHYDMETRPGKQDEIKRK